MIDRLLDALRPGRRQERLGRYARLQEQIAAREREVALIRDQLARSRPERRDVAAADASLLSFRRALQEEELRNKEVELQSLRQQAAPLEPGPVVLPAHLFRPALLMPALAALIVLAMIAIALGTGVFRGPSGPETVSGPPASVQPLASETSLPSPEAAMPTAAETALSSSPVAEMTPTVTLELTRGRGGPSSPGIATPQATTAVGVGVASIASPTEVPQQPETGPAPVAQAPASVATPGELAVRAPARVPPAGGLNPGAAAAVLLVLYWAGLGLRLLSREYRRRING